MKKRNSTERLKSAPASRRITTRQRKVARIRSKQPEPIDTMVTASAEALGLAIDPAWQKDVVFNLQLIMQHGARVDEFALPDEAEPAPVYRA